MNLDSHIHYIESTTPQFHKSGQNSKFENDGLNLGDLGKRLTKNGYGGSAKVLILTRRLPDIPGY
jgi:hypothetical protein